MADKMVDRWQTEAADQLDRLYMIQDGFMTFNREHAGRLLCDQWLQPLAEMGFDVVTLTMRAIVARHVDLHAARRPSFPD